MNILSLTFRLEKRFSHRVSNHSAPESPMTPRYSFRLLLGVKV